MLAESVRAKYLAEAGPLFKLALKTTFLTIITFGFYRFWAKTRIRRYIWSGISVGGDSMEYLGKGLEKFLGFLIAVAFLSVYLGLLQLLLSFLGLSAFNAENEASMQASFNLTFLAIVPFIFYAQYRARRYMLSRTRWRGIRFGAEQAAWGYVWLGLWTTALVTVTFGIMLPYQTYRLEKYKTDRTWYGTGKFEQTGKWTPLYRPLLNVYLGFVIALIGIGIAVSSFTSEPTDSTHLPVGLAALSIFVGLIWFWVALENYRVKSWCILTSGKTLNGEVLFVSEPGTTFVITTYIVGAIIMAVVLIVLGAVLLASIGAFSFERDLVAVLSSLDPIRITTTIIGYLVIFGVYSALSLVLFTQPILGHYVDETAVLNAGGLDAIEQRPEDDFAEADGFADALDIGAAI